MQAKTIISVLAIAIGASTLPTTETQGPTCSANQVLACCNSIAGNGTGLGCLYSSKFSRDRSRVRQMGFPLLTPLEKIKP